MQIQKYVTNLVTYMAGNSRLATAIHVAGMLSFADRMPITSEAIAQSCGTNAVVIRRVIGLLTKHGLVAVKKGTGGGARLTREPERITLGDIYDALDEGALFDVPQFDASHECELGKVVRPVLSDILGEAEFDLRHSLSERTLAEVIELVRLKMTDSCRQAVVAE
ncbi:MAG: Rrf2 family transcriptional regulator [Acidobacteria bacterium]|nr:Rrf2 family transcriptional regulator [Acidobacteriota bacterium]MBK8811444.1 Rrf2 family transcriptional regulator [Acidobacteriota bacterium]